MQRTVIHLAVLAAVALLTIVVLTHYAPFDTPSYAFWAGVILALAGLASLVRPVRLLLIRTRRVAAIAALAGVAVSIAALWCPFRVVHAGQRTLLDKVLPTYHFHEVHSARVPGPPDLALRAMNQVTLDDLKVYRLLMGARVLATGQIPRFSGTDRPLMATLASGPFPPVAEEPGREIVLGGPMPVRGGRVMIAFNVRVDDEGGNWTRITTETRIRGENDAAARNFARYWRAIYPGSAIIRQMWLDAAVSRVEQAAGKR